MVAFHGTSSWCLEIITSRLPELEVASGLGATHGLTFHERVYSPLKPICTLGLHNIL